MTLHFAKPVFKGLTVRDLVRRESQISAKASVVLWEVGLCAKVYRQRGESQIFSGGSLKRIEIAMVSSRGTKLSVLMSRRQVLICGVFRILFRFLKGMSRCRAQLLFPSEE